MDTNEINRRVRYALSLDDRDVLQLLELANYPTIASSVTAWRLKAADEGFIACPPEALKAMLAGLITQRRGPATTPYLKRPGRSLPNDIAGDKLVNDSQPIDNNALLKQLRIALSLKTDEVHELILAGGGTLGKSEVNAFFRKPDARNYRRCGDQVFRWFLNGLAELRESNE